MTRIAVSLNAISPATAMRAPRAWGRAGCLALAVAATALLAGCTNAPRHSIIVGSIPDDYRTNHPIVVGEKEQILDLPVGASSYGMTEFQRTRLAGFLDDYDPRTAAFVAILVPSGSLNEAAAHRTSRDVAAYLRSRGVSRGEIVVQPYQSPLPDVSPPIRVSYTATKAYTNRCGRWPDDMLESTDNKHYENFGCAYQNNLAAQVANPTDLLGPRRMSPIDAENRDVAIGDYKAHTVSDKFIGQSEIEY
jgi:pilus assembly protein CpaD